MAFLGSKNGISAWIINIFSLLLLVFSFLQDSLDLSHDEIHRSLQANMAANRSNGHAVDLNPMEFIEQNGGKIFSSKFFKTPFLGVWAFGFSLNTYENWTSFCCLPFIVKLIGVANWFVEKKKLRAIIFSKSCNRKWNFALQNQQFFLSNHNVIFFFPIFSNHFFKFRSKTPFFVAFGFSLITFNENETSF